MSENKVGYVVGNDINRILPQGLAIVASHGRLVTAASLSNQRETLEVPGVFVTEYTNPRQCVLFDPARDCNPFFHFAEALWIIKGRNDVAFLKQFNAQMAAYSDDGQVFHAPYGYRLRHWTDGQFAEGLPEAPFASSGDQIEKAIKMLRDAPTSRQVAMSIWDPSWDLGAQSKDIPCNDFLMLKIRQRGHGRYVLNMTVANRSNDMIWGAYGANVVQFSMLLMYLAARIGNVGVGTYTQLSDSMHVYTDTPYWKHYQDYGPYKGSSPYEFSDLYLGVDRENIFGGSDMQRFDAELDKFFAAWDADPLQSPPADLFKDRVVRDLAHVTAAYRLYKAKDKAGALAHVGKLHADDWRLACTQWLERRK